MKFENRLQRFIEDQDNLDAIYFLMKGDSYREIGDKIGRSHSFVQRVNMFLQNHGLSTGKKWRIDSNAMGMTKKYKFYEYKRKRNTAALEDIFQPDEVVKFDDFLTFYSEVKKGVTEYFAIYTFPNEHKQQIGEKMSPYYYYIPKFKAPLLKNNINLNNFKNSLGNETNENPLPPRGIPLDPDLIHIEIARYIELFGNPHVFAPTDNKALQENDIDEFNLWKLVYIIGDDIKEEGLLGKVDVTYDIVRNRYNEMIEKNIIYPGFGLEMRNLEYELCFCWIEHSEIYKIMKALGNYNIISAISYTKKDKYLLHIQYYKKTEEEVMKILNYLDPQNEVFKVLEIHNNRTIPYPYYFEKEKKKK